MKGRVVPAVPKARIARALAMKAAHGAEMQALAQLLPDAITLNDGRKLRYESPMSGGKAYYCADEMVVIATFDPTPHGTLLHVSASYADRDPTWHDLKQLRAAFFPDDQDVIQLLPRAGVFVEIHEHCFHLYQAPEAWRGGWNV